jgi:hypothetical protein
MLSGSEGWQGQVRSQEQEHLPRAITTKLTKDTKTALTWQAACGGLAV